jgi:hypothetical protein
MEESAKDAYAVAVAMSLVATPKSLGGAWACRKFPSQATSYWNLERHYDSDVFERRRYYSLVLTIKV